MCVVVVTTSACWKGEGITPAATSPEMWAISASSTDLVASQISRNLIKPRLSHIRENTFIRMDLA